MISIHSWRGSIYKLLWPNMAVYILLFYTLYFVYIFALNEQQQRFRFELFNFSLSPVQSFNGTNIINNKKEPISA